MKTPQKGTKCAKMSTLSPDTSSRDGDSRDTTADGCNNIIAKDCIRLLINSLCFMSAKRFR